MEPFVPPTPSTGFFPVLWGLGAFAKIIVLVLLVFSIISWAIILKKFFSFRRIKKSNEFLYSLFKERKSVLEFSGIASEYPHSLLSHLAVAGVEEFQKITKHNPLTAIETNRNKSADLINLLPNVSDALARSSSAQIEQLEQNLGFLATCGSVAPFLGLLGTVWGILSAFLGVKHVPVVTLQIIAPGISDALVTTVVGLLVAIPAVIAFNYFIGKVRDFSNEMERWSLEIVGDLRKVLVEST